MRFRLRFLTLVTFAFGLAACHAYDYEEEVFLEVDGSGRIRVSGSGALLKWIHGVEPPTVEAMRARFENPSLEIDSVRETERDGRRFLHLQGRFADWNELCGHPVFRTRRCRLSENKDGELELRFTVPAADARGVPEDVVPDAVLAFRFHLPSKVRFHNSPAPVERGNIVRWERSAAEYFGGASLDAEVRFERRSVLESTFVVLGTALGLVVLTAALGLLWMVRKGRRQIRDDARAPGGRGQL